MPSSPKIWRIASSVLTFSISPPPDLSHFFAGAPPSFDPTALEFPIPRL
jgi:hypothetical protein